jgi:spore maturation protein CgeB
MKILIVNQNQRIYNPTSISFSLYRAFKENNIECDTYDLSYYVNRYFNFFIKKNKTLRHSLLQEVNQQFVNVSTSADYTHLFIVKGTFLLPESLKQIKKLRPAIKLCCFNPDDPYNPDTWGGSNHPNIKNAIPYYDHYFIWSKKLMTKIKNSGVTHTHYLPFAIDHQLIKKFENIDTIFNLSFIGNSDTERQAWINKSAQLIKENSVINIIDIFGLYWKKHPKLTLNGGKFGEDYFKVFYESKININILRNQNKGETNMRTFEIPATGNFMLHEVSESAMSFFEPDVDAVYFNSSEELIDKAEFYLKNESLRLKIAQSGYQKSQNYGYSYRDRVKELVLKLNE